MRELRRGKRHKGIGGQHLGTVQVLIHVQRTYPVVLDHIALGDNSLRIRNHVNLASIPQEKVGQVLRQIMDHNAFHEPNQLKLARPVEP